MILTAREFKARQEWVKKNFALLLAVQGGTASIPAPDAPVLSIDSYPSSTSVLIEWTEPNGSPTSYNVYVDDVLFSNVATLTETVTGLTAGVPADIYVKAVNAGGEGAASNTVVAEGATTETFAYNDSNIMYVGSSGDGTVDGKQFRAMYREWNFEVKGSSISLSLWLGTGEVFIEVDGTLVEQETGTTWEDVVAPIPNDGQWHFVSVRRRDYNGGMTLNKTDPLVSVTGNPPQIRYPINYASPLIDCRIAASGSYCQGDGTLGDSSYGRPIYQHFGYLRFRAATSSIRVRLLNPGSVGVYQDGAYLGSLTTTDVHPDFSWCPSAVTTNSSSESEFIIAGDFHIQAISAANVNTSALAAEDTWQIFGDSITRGFGVTNAWNKWGGQLGIIKRKGVRLYGVDGATLAGSAASIGGWANDVDPKYAFLMYGRNDVGSTSVANYKNAMYTALHDLCGVASVTKIYVIGMLNYTGNGSGRTDLNTAASEVCAGGATGSGTLTGAEVAKITYINSDGLITPATHTSDGTHLNDLGGQVLAAALAPLIT